MDNCQPISCGSSVTLSQLHQKLNLSQSSLPSSLSGLPSRLNFIGVITSYAEISLVAWQKEVLFTIIDSSGVETLKISMWLNHENPIGLRFVHLEDIIGRVAFFKNVCIKSFDYTDPTNLQFYGEMNPPSVSMHTIILPVLSGEAYVRFIKVGTPFRVDSSFSLIPKILQKKHVAFQFPLLMIGNDFHCEITYR